MLFVALLTFLLFAHRLGRRRVSALQVNFFLYVVLQVVSHTTNSHQMKGEEDATKPDAILAVVDARSKVSGGTVELPVASVVNIIYKFEITNGFSGVISNEKEIITRRLT